MSKESFTQRLRITLNNTLGYPPKEKAAIGGWKRLQASDCWEETDEINCTACGQCMTQESKISIFNLMKPPVWSIAKGCEGFDEDGNQIRGINCVLQTIE